MKTSVAHKHIQSKKASAKRSLPRAFVRAAGLLKGKLKKTPVQYQRSLRKEWS